MNDTDVEKTTSVSGDQDLSLLNALICKDLFFL
jgi:hypothetical protein